MPPIPPPAFEMVSGGLIVRLADRTILDNKLAAFTAVAALIEAQRPRATLVDFRGVPGPIGFLDRYELGEMAGRYLAGRKIAALLREDQMDHRRLAQLVAANRGANTELFTDEAAAKAWMSQLTSASS